MSMKVTEGRLDAFARNIRCDLEPHDAESERKLAEAEWRRRQHLAREQRKVIVAQIDEKIIEPGLDLQDEAAMELGLIRFPQGLEDLAADLEEDIEIGGAAALLLTTQSPLLADLAAA